MTFKGLITMLWDLEVSETEAFTEDPNADEVFGVTRLSDDEDGNREYLIGLYGGGATEAVKTVSCYKDLEDAVAAELENTHCPFHVINETERVLTNSPYLDENVFTVGFLVTGRVHVNVRGVKSAEEARRIATDLCGEYDFGDLEHIEWDSVFVEDPQGNRIP